MNGNNDHNNKNEERYAMYHGPVTILIALAFFIISIVYGGTFEKLVLIAKTEPMEGLSIAHKIIAIIGLVTFFIAIIINIYFGFRYRIIFNEHKEKLRKIIDMKKLADSLIDEQPPFDQESDTFVSSHRHTMEPSKNTIGEDVENPDKGKLIYEVPPTPHKTWKILIKYLQLNPKVEFQVSDGKIKQGKASWDIRLVDDAVKSAIPLTVLGWILIPLVGIILILCVIKAVELIF